MQIESIDGDIAIVGMGNTRLRISIALLENPAVNDYVLVHAGFAIRRIDEAEAEETVRLLNELVEFSESRIPGLGSRVS